MANLKVMKGLKEDKVKKSTDKPKATNFNKKPIITN